jgi:hypothetical protein
LRGVAKSSRNEEELRVGAVNVLGDFSREVGLELEARHEYALGRGGRADTVYSGVLIEFEPPASLSDHNDAAPNRHAIAQVQRYAETMAQQDAVNLARILGVATDGQRIIFVRHRRGAWDVQRPLEVDQASVAHLLFCLKSLQAKALLPDNLVQDFGAHPDKTAGQCVRALYCALQGSSKPKVQALFAQWRLLFSEVCGYELDSPRLDVRALADSYGVDSKRVSGERLFFCVHSYYATLIKLLAAEIVTFYSASYLPSYLGGLESLPDEDLRRELVELEQEGGLFGQLGIRNFLEGDFFAWHLEDWNEELATATRGMIKVLRSYDPATVRVDSDETRDLLKQLYQYLLPKKLRHDLGEYYTPDWLAELVLEEIGYDGDVSKRILDPACGSGTFPVLEIKRAREWARDKFLSDTETLEQILSNIVGFDLNPLAVITARTNYLIALGDLLRHRRGEIEIPVYLCDAVLTPSEGRQLTIDGRYCPLETAVGTFNIPLTVATQERMSALAALLERAVSQRWSPPEFLDHAATDIGLTPNEFTEAQERLATLYAELCRVEAEGRNGIWARIIKNFFAPVFAGSFDYVAGNPPWINWENLPDKYRKSTQPLWEEYGLFTLKGWRARMGGGKKDLSALFLYVAAHKYLKDGGKLGFLITESLFKSSGGGEGFRGFALPPSPGEHPVGLKVLQVHDLVALKPFEAAANRTAIIALQKGAPTQYPVPYLVWRKRQGKRTHENMTLAEARVAAPPRTHAAFPITSKRGAPWITGPAGALEAVQKAIGKSEYRAWAGACTWLNGVYWVRILEELPDGTVLIENLHDVGKIAVPQTRARVERDLLYPLLRGRDVQPWRAQPQDFILMVQDPHTRKGYAEREMRDRWPLTYAYFKRFEKELRARSGFRKYFKPDDPFYSMYNVGPPTFAEYKAVWREQAARLTAAVVGLSTASKHPLAIIPDHKIMLVSCVSQQSASFVCALLNSSPSRYIVAAYVIETQTSTHVLDHVKVPVFNPKSALHRRLARLSQWAHKAAARGDAKRVAEIEAEVDEAAAELWGITARELRTIQKALRQR